MLYATNKILLNFLVYLNVDCKESKGFLFNFGWCNQ